VRIDHDTPMVKMHSKQFLYFFLAPGLVAALVGWGLEWYPSGSLALFVALVSFAQWAGTTARGTTLPVLGRPLVRAAVLAGVCALAYTGFVHQNQGGWLELLPGGGLLCQPNPPRFFSMAIVAAAAAPFAVESVLVWLSACCEPPSE